MKNLLRPQTKKRRTYRRRKPRNPWLEPHVLIGIGTLSIIIGLSFYGNIRAWAAEPQVFISPVPDDPAIGDSKPDGFFIAADIPTPTPTGIPTPTPTPTLTEQEELDRFIGDAVDEFFKSSYTRSAMRATMHCLASKESKHAFDKGHGDGGLAGGPFQFHEATWERMRRQMIKDGYATEIGTRYDLGEAASTVAYAFKKGWAREWGPILRFVNGTYGSKCELPTVLK